MVGDLEKSSFSNIEQQSLEFVKYTLDPWVVRWEQNLQRILLTTDEKKEYFFKFNVDGLLRGDYASRMSGYATARQNGWMSANDIRELENLDRIPEELGGDLYLINGNMLPMQNAGAFADKNTEETEENTNENSEVLEVDEESGGHRENEECWFDDDVTPQLFKDELLAGEGDVTVWINSPGGDCVAAAQIYNMLMEYKGNVTVKIDGIAASAASVIAMAGTTVLMSPVSMMMIHNPMTLALGDKSEMEKAIDMLEAVKDSIINAYEIKTGLSRAKISHLMDEETWMDAHKAVELGFADDILERPSLKTEPDEDKDDDEDEGDTPPEKEPAKEPDTDEDEDDDDKEKNANAKPSKNAMIFSRRSFDEKQLKKLSPEKQKKHTPTGERSVAEIMNRLETIKKFM